MGENPYEAPQAVSERPGEDHGHYPWLGRAVKLFILGVTCIMMGGVLFGIVTRLWR
jgi:hypothetical protein